MRVAQNPHLDQAQSAPFAFRSTKRLGVYQPSLIYATGLNPNNHPTTIDNSLLSLDSANDSLDALIIIATL